MNELLFQPEILAPVRYMSPGDVVRSRHARLRSPTLPKSPPRERREVRKFNPFRQAIAAEHETEFRHMNWAGMRAKVRNALVGNCASHHVLERFDNCGAECLVEWSEELQKYRLSASYCRCRHCRPCSKAKGSLIAANLTAKLAAGAEEGGDRFRFITLTLRHSDRPLLEQIKNLYRHWNALRRSPFWKRSQRGGAAMIEVGLNKRGEWHPHLHIISEGDFLFQPTLANTWMKITGGSFKVDVRAINSGKDASRYVAKYVAKGTSDDVWNSPTKAIEWVCATKGLRTCATYGTWRGFKLLRPDPATVAKDWKPVNLLTAIIRQAEAGSLADQILLVRLADALQYDPTRSRKSVPTTGDSA